MHAEAIAYTDCCLLTCISATGSQHCAYSRQGPSEENQMITGDRVRQKVFVLTSIEFSLPIDFKRHIVENY